MGITQTRYFKEDCDHYTRLAIDHKHTSDRDKIRRALYRLDGLRGKAYTDALAAKCNQRAKTKFYYREEGKE